MNGVHRWRWRFVIGVLIFGVTEVVCVLFDTGVDHLRLAMVVALLVTAGSVLMDASQVDASPWPHHPARAEGAGGQDPRTASYQRILESHRSAREPDGALRDRLGDLADQVLWVRHDMTRAEPAASELLGPDLVRVLTEPPRRLSVAEIDQHVRRIEAM